MIEFRCQQCDAVLRTPAGTEGKQAKCPQCGTLMTIPTPPPVAPRGPISGNAGPADFSAPPPREGAFAAPGPAAGPRADSDNPFQAPQFGNEPQYGSGVRGFRPTRIEFGRTFDFAWRVYKSNLGLLVGASLIVFAVSMVVGMLIAGADIAVTGIENQHRNQNPVSALINLVGQLVSAVLQTFLYLGTLRLSLNVARREPASISDLFGEGHNVAKTIGANILFVLCCLAGLLLLVIPAIWVALTFSLFWFMILDQNAGVIDSLKMSAAAMRGNKLTLLGLWLALIGISLLVVIPTCGLGLVFVTPFMAVLLTAVYLGATGQLSDPTVMAPAEA